MLKLCQFDDATQQMVGCVDYTFSILPQLTLEEATMLGIAYWTCLAVAYGFNALKNSN